MKTPYWPASVEKKVSRVLALFLVVYVAPPIRLFHLAIVGLRVGI